MSKCRRGSCQSCDKQREIERQADVIKRLKASLNDAYHRLAGVVGMGVTDDSQIDNARAAIVREPEAEL